MARGKQIAALGACLAAFALWLAALPGRSQARSQGAIITGNPAPSPAEIHSLIVRAVENQHRDEYALEEFERTEHIVTRKGENAEIITDLTERILPTPTGNFKLKLSENGTPVPVDLYRQELGLAVTALGLTAHPTDRYSEDQAKFERRRREHAELVNSSLNAFLITWAGRETRADSSGTHGPRTLVKLLLDPAPDFKPATRFATSFQHAHATLWVDESEAQFARLEGEITTDITFGGGIAAKIYHGGHVLMVQEEVEPGLWLPTQFDYEVDGRKFVFSFGVHERTDISRYRRIGPPAKALEIIRNELNTLSAAVPSQ